MSGLDAEALVLLTNVDGVLKKPAASSGESEKSGLISPRHRSDSGVAIARNRSLLGGRGGMLTKLEAAEIAMNCGGTAVIANGQMPEVLDRIFAGEPVGTTFLPSKRLRGKKRWIAYAADVRGKIVVDRGARQALVAGKASLLRSGMVRIESHFAPLDVVSILDEQGTEFARGISACASSESEAASRILVRRDNIVLLEAP